MKVVVIGGTGLIGSKVVGLLQRGGHEVIAASPSSGVNTYTGEGLDAVLAGVDTVVDVANAPDFADGPVLDFFITAGRNLLAAETRAGVSRHLALSVVGSERLLDSGYLRAKLVQEALIRAFARDYLILRATQFFEFLPAIAQQATTGDTVRLSPGLFQPIASNDLAEALAEFAIQPGARGVVEIGGPEACPMCDLVQRYLASVGDSRRVIADADAPYFGAILAERSLVPGPAAKLGPTRYDDWLTSSRTAARAG